MPNLSGFTDESKYQAMLKNRPNPNIFPSPNRRILAQRMGHGAFINIALIGIFFGVFITQAKEQQSLRLYPTRKVFSFKSDPLTGAVNCTYQEKTYQQEGY
jgi:hypothetical protein